MLPEPASNIRSNMTMLPELVSIIREYSKPAFKYFREVNAYKRLHGNADLLQIKLGGGDAEHVAEVLREYLEAVENWRVVENLYYDLPRPRQDSVQELVEYRVDQARLREEARYALWQEEWYHHELRAALLGRVLYPFREYEPIQVESSWRRVGGRWV